MIPAEEARFIALWNAGTATAAIAQALGIPLGIVAALCTGHGRAVM
jgi:hypothetical protein